MKGSPNYEDRMIQTVVVQDTIERIQQLLYINDTLEQRKERIEYYYNLYYLSQEKALKAQSEALDKGLTKRYFKSLYAEVYYYLCITICLMRTINIEYEFIQEDIDKTIELFSISKRGNYLRSLDSLLSSSRCIFSHKNIRKIGAIYQ